MILSDRDLAAAIESGRLKLENWSGRIGPASIDLHLEGDFVDGWDREHPRRAIGYPLRSLEFVLGSTVEVITLADDLCAQVAGCSSLARQGIQIESAGFVDPGWSGDLTLEILNMSPQVRTLMPGMRICQLVVFQMTSPAERPYGSPGVGRYQGQRGATPARPELAVNPLCGSAVPCAHDPEE